VQCELCAFDLRDLPQLSAVEEVSTGLSKYSKGYDTAVSCGSEDIVSVYGSICNWI